MPALGQGRQRDLPGRREVGPQIDPRLIAVGVHDAEVRRRGVLFHG
jgi:hypothetical protein